MRENRIAITGMGMVSALGHTARESYEAACKGTTGFRRCDELLWGEYGEELKCRVAATIVDLDAEHVINPKIRKTYSRGTLYALVAGEEAITDAEIPPDEAVRERVGIVIGSACPSIDLYHRMCWDVFEEGKAHRLSGSVAPQISTTAPAAQMAMRHGFRGPNLVMSTACASGASVLALAADQIRAGRADIVVAGGTESPVTPMTIGSFLTARAMNPTDEPEGCCRPFDAARAGMILGEGSGFFVVEDWDHAVSRGAHIHAELLGSAMTEDAYHMWAPEAGSWARTIELALRDAGIAPGDVDYVSAHGVGTLTDTAETAALKSALGDHAYNVPVSATKSMHGHAFAASAAMESILALQAMSEGRVLPTVGLTEPDPECDLDYVPDLDRHQGSEILLKNGFGFGGTNTVAVLRVVV